MAIARWKDLCIDATDAHRMARFWGELLGLEIELHDDGDAALRGERPEQTIWVNAVPEPRTVKQRVHLDVVMPSLDAVLALGATLVAPAAETGFHWDGLFDPEGGELCAFVRDDRPTAVTEMIIDTADAQSSHSQAAWWADVWGGRVIDHDSGYSWIEEVPGLPFETIDFIPVPEPKTVKNRIHWDITSDDRDGLLQRGATILAELPSWTVMADREGNEFCVFGES